MLCKRKTVCERPLGLAEGLDSTGECEDGRTSPRNGCYGRSLMTAVFANRRNPIHET